MSEKVTARSNGLMKNQSDTSTGLTSLFGSRKLQSEAGVTNTARLRAAYRENPSCSATSPSSSSIAQRRRARRGPAKLPDRVRREVAELDPLRLLDRVGVDRRV